MTMNRRTFIAGGATIVSGIGIVSWNALASDDDGRARADGSESRDTDGTTESGDKAAEADTEDEIEREGEPEPEGEGESEPDPETESDGEEEATDRPEDATDTIEIASHDIQIEEFPRQDYTEVYVTGELASGDHTLRNVRVDAIGLDENGESIAHEFEQYATIDPNSCVPFEVPLYVEPSRLGSYQVAITAAEYA